MTSYHEVLHGSEASQHLKTSVGKKGIQRSFPASKEGRKKGKKERKRDSMKERRQREKRRKEKREKQNAKRYFGLLGRVGLTASKYKQFE